MIADVAQFVTDDARDFVAAKCVEETWWRKPVACCGFRPVAKALAWGLSIK